MNPSDESKTPQANDKEAGSPPSPRASKKKSHGWFRNLSILLLLVIALGEAVYILRERLSNRSKPASETATSPERKILYWQNPMNPQAKYDKPGKAPDGMDLVPVYANEPTQTPARTEKRILYWVDPMNPQRKSDKPGKAPDGMDLVPVYAEAQSAQGTPPEGAFKISPDKQQLIGVQYGEVTMAPLVKTFRAVASLNYDEKKIARIHPKIEGWIEKVYVDFTGQLVAKNQPLLSIYSPELVATQEEYLLAVRARSNLGGSSFKDVANSADSLLAAARRRLQLWDISEQQISEIEGNRTPLRTLTLYSPVSGFVTARNSYEKQRITPETELYQIVDLSTLWAIIDLYEYEARDVKLGQEVLLTIVSFPGRTFRGKVTYIYPQVENATRTVRVRVELPNPDFALKPDMYANAELKVEYGERLSIPQEAVLNSGAEQQVFVALDDGYFAPRKVRLGDRVDNRVIVLSGLKAGEKIVTSGNFLIDSESNLKSAASGMGMPGMEHGGGTGSRPQKSPQSTPPSMNKSQRPGGKTAPKKEKPMDESMPGMDMNPEPSRHD